MVGNAMIFGMLAVSRPAEAYSQQIRDLCSTSSLPSLCDRHHAFFSVHRLHSMSRKLKEASETIYLPLGIIEIVSRENVAAAKKPDVVLYSGFHIALLVLIFGNLAANQGLVLKYSKSKA